MTARKPFLSVNAYLHRQKLPMLDIDNNYILIDTFSNLIHSLLIHRYLARQEQANVLYRTLIEQSNRQTMDSAISLCIAYSKATKTAKGGLANIINQYLDEIMSVLSIGKSDNYTPSLDEMDEEINEAPSRIKITIGEVDIAVDSTTDLYSLIVSFLTDPYDTRKAEFVI